MLHLDVKLKLFNNLRCLNIWAPKCSRLCKFFGTGTIYDRILNFLSFLNKYQKLVCPWIQPVTWTQYYFSEHKYLKNSFVRFFIFNDDDRRWYRGKIKVKAYSLDSYMVMIFKPFFFGENKIYSVSSRDVLLELA